jgi:hypothetical protein
MESGIHERARKVFRNEGQWQKSQAVTDLEKRFQLQGQVVKEWLKLEGAAAQAAVHSPGLPIKFQNQLLVPKLKKF